MKTRQWAASIFMFAVLAVPVQSQDAKISTCTALDSWASRLNELPKDYESFTALSPGRRQAVYRLLSDAERADLWQHQLVTALERDSWTAAQRSLILEAIDDVTPGNMAEVRSAGPSRKSLLEKARDFQLRAENAFGRAQALELFSQIGPVREHSVVVFAGAPPSPNPVTTDPYGPDDACNCNVNSPTCPSGDCWAGSCIESAGGCGTYGFFPCEGRCFRY